MKIQVLPIVVCIVDSLIVDRLIGFDDLGGTDQFTSKQLEDRLISQSSKEQVLVLVISIIFIIIYFFFLLLGIFHIPHKLKKSADRRDRDPESSNDSD